MGESQEKTRGLSARSGKGENGSQSSHVSQATVRQVRRRLEATEDDVQGLAAVVRELAFASLPKLMDLHSGARGRQLVSWPCASSPHVRGRVHANPATPTPPRSTI
jgi:hypothetical protein